MQDPTARRVRRNLVLPLALLLAATLLLWPTDRARADGEPIRVLSSSVTSEFPEGIRFKLQVDGDNEITSIAVRFRVGQQTTGAYEYLDYQQVKPVDSELFWRTNTIARYIPPGTIITYSFEIEDSEGLRLDTEQREFVYADARLEWEEVSDGPIAVAYHGPVRTRAMEILDAITQTIAHMGPLLGADMDIPIRVTMYNNVKEMLEALPPGSSTHRRELITEGQAFSEMGTLLILGGGRAANGTASHEVTHILVFRAGQSVFRGVPSWLNEGLAEYGNVAPTVSYDIALEYALGVGYLPPITRAEVLPGVPEAAIIFYGQARSIVRFMVGRFGPSKIGDLMAALKSGARMDDALLQVYGVDRLGLENLWRDWIGAPAYSPSDTRRTRPTPVARPALLPYSLTPQAQAVAVGGKSDTPTPIPEPTATPEPTVTPAPEPTPVPTPTAEAAALARVLPPADKSSQATSEYRGEESGSRGGACNARQPGDPPIVDMSMVALIVGPGVLWLRRRLRPRG